MIRPALAAVLVAALSPSLLPAQPLGDAAVLLFAQVRKRALDRPDPFTRAADAGEAELLMASTFRKGILRRRFVNYLLRAPRDTAADLIEEGAEVVDALTVEIAWGRGKSVGNPLDTLGNSRYFQPTREARWSETYAGGQLWDGVILTRELELDWQATCGRIAPDQHAWVLDGPEPYLGFQVRLVARSEATDREHVVTHVWKSTEAPDAAD